MRDRLGDFGDCAVAVVTFAPTADLAGYRAHLDLPFPVLSDPDRAEYRRFGFPRASYRAVYSRGTIQMYRRLIRQGRTVKRPTQDTRQLGGDVVLDPEGLVAAVFRPRSPDDRPAIEILVDAVAESRRTSRG